MPVRKRKPVEANDGSYGGMVLAAFDRLEESKAFDPETLHGMNQLKTDSKVEDHIAIRNEIRFYRASGQWGFLSNLYRMPVAFWLPEEFDGAGCIFRRAAYFKTTEAAYQYGKPAKQEVADWIVSAPAPHLCAAAAHGLFVFDVRPDWNAVKVDRMRRVLRIKFDRCEQYELWRQLQATGDAELIEESKTDAFWGIGKKGNGKNMLGKLLMELRSEQRSEWEEEKKRRGIEE